MEMEMEMEGKGKGKENGKGKVKGNDRKEQGFARRRNTPNLTLRHIVDVSWGLLRSVLRPPACYFQEFAGKEMDEKVEGKLETAYCGRFTGFVTVGPTCSPEIKAKHCYSK